MFLFRPGRRSINLRIKVFPPAEQEKYDDAIHDEVYQGHSTSRPNRNHYTRFGRQMTMDSYQSRLRTDHWEQIGEGEQEKSTDQEPFDIIQVLLLSDESDD